MAKHVQNFVLGAGRLYFDPEDSDGNLTGERYLGNTPGFEIQVESENVELWDSDGPIAEKVEDVTTQVTRATTIQCNNINDANLALFVVGSMDDVVSTADSVTAEPIGGGQDLVGGRYYQLGVSSDTPTGARAVANVSVHDDDTTTYVEGDDYELDAELGRVYIIEGGALDGAPGWADYDTTEGSRTQVITGDMGAVDGALRFIADNTRGRNRDLYAPRVQLRPDGSLAFKSRDEWMQMQFQAELLRRGDRAALYIDGRQVVNA